MRPVSYTHLDVYKRQTYVAIKRFALSFTTDYAAIGTTETFEGTNMPEISVYASMGREQYEILQNLVTESFTRDHNIKVNLTMVNGAEGIICLLYTSTI